VRARTATIPLAGAVLAALITGALAGVFPRSDSASAALRSHSTHAIYLTQDDSGRRFTIDVGDHVHVKLTGPTLYTWSEPTASKTAVLQRVSGTSGSTAKALLVAVASGRSNIIATDNPDCYPQCLPPSRLFRVTIKVLK